MTASTLTAIVLALITLLASWRFRHAGWALRCLQPALAVTLFFALLPPMQAGTGDAVVLFTAGASRAQIARYAQAPQRYRLPDAPLVSGARAVPDLATALAWQPSVNTLKVVGSGLSLRDRAALAGLGQRGMTVQFDAAPLPRGLRQWWPQRTVTLGRVWSLRGRVERVPGGSVELLDPAGHLAAVAKLDRSGQFLLQDQARTVGNVSYRVRVRDHAGAVVEAASVPVSVQAGAPLRVLVLAGGPDPELKYLRRWALDAGLAVQTQISLGAGMQLGAVALDSTTLSKHDVLILDERAWRAMSPARQAMLKDAVRAGLGLLLRITGPLSSADRARLRDWGFAVSATEQVLAARLPALATAPVADDPATGSAATPDLSRQALAVDAADGVTVARDAAGRVVAVRRAEGRGRVALWWLSGTWRLLLAGQAPTYGQWWSAALADVARANTLAPPHWLSADPQVDQRVALCGLAGSAQLSRAPEPLIAPATESAPEPAIIPWLIDGQGCAAFWPTAPGWYQISQGEQRWPLWVRPRGERAGVDAAQDQQATQALVGHAVAAVAGSRGPGSRWPWLLAWLLSAALSWWLERKTPPSFEDGVGSTGA